MKAEDTYYTIEDAEAIARAFLFPDGPLTPEGLILAEDVTREYLRVMALTPDMPLVFAKVLHSIRGAIGADSPDAYRA